MADDITNIRISDQRQKKLAARAATGQYLHAAGHPGSVIAVDAQMENGMQLTVGKLYMIVATGMPGTMNMQFDHEMHAADGTLYVFYEVRNED